MELLGYLVELTKQSLLGYPIYPRWKGGVPSLTSTKRWFGSSRSKFHWQPSISEPKTSKASKFRKEGLIPPAAWIAEIAQLKPNRVPR
ncbi:hypothetical protein SASPL_155515 (mitochondrion) [Salvia splendens]|uniref:Uncharacterized protein n=1 Tax=Salvia splendens TaxID=180675 RepID=A0A8X8VX26_SALSN|nr:hypothetical protein SASPL_156322 [Salvia splendens]KAG6383926.1 hypothetical protein SASPL_156355 [Salvia splendens]KAG6384663.1 hypothetical protein SASPL_155515 [Salvia splendens]